MALPSPRFPVRSAGTIPTPRSGELLQRQSTGASTCSGDGRCIPILFGLYMFEPVLIHAEIEGIYAHLVYLVSAGPIKSTLSWATAELAGKNIAGPDLPRWVTGVAKYGATDQTEDTTIPSVDWASSLPGQAYVHLVVNTLIAPIGSGQIPSYVIYTSGRATPGSHGAARTAGDMNPVRHTVDLLTNAEFGMVIGFGDIDWESVEDSAEHCDETVTGTDGDRARYSNVCCVILERQDGLQCCRDMLITCQGRLWVSGDTWGISLDKRAKQVTFVRASGAYLPSEPVSDYDDHAPRWEPDGPFADALVIEEGTTNLLSANQASVETGTTGFTLYGATSTISRVTTEALHGVASLKCVTKNTTAIEGCQTSLVSGLTPSVPHAASVWVKGSGTVRVTLREYTAASVYVGGTNGTLTALTGTWQRLTVARTFGATGVQARVLVVTAVQQAATFYMDCWQIEQKAFATSWQLSGEARANEVASISKADAKIVDGCGTIECWIRLLRSPGTNNQTIYDGNGAANRELTLVISTGGLLIATYDTPAAAVVTVVGSTVFVKETWYHVAMIWHRSGVAIYVNGVEEDSDPREHNIRQGTTVYIGSTAAGASQLDGMISDLKISDVAKTAAEILAAYQANEPVAVDQDTAIKLPLAGHLEAIKGLICDPIGTDIDGLERITTNIGILSKGAGETSLVVERRRNEAINQALVRCRENAGDMIEIELHDESAGVSDGTEQPRPLRATVPVSNADQAFALARQWVRQAQAPLRIGVTVPHHAVILLPGDVVEITSVVGPLANKLMLVNSIQDNPNGTFDLELNEYVRENYDVTDLWADDRGQASSIDNSETDMARREDEFSTGGTTSGTLGELGWVEVDLLDVFTVTYPAVEGHSGVLHIESGAVTNQGFWGYREDSMLFAGNSVWCAEFIFRLQADDALDGRAAAVGVGYDWIGSVWPLVWLAIDETGAVSINGVDTGETCALGDWMLVQIWGDGANLAHVRGAWGTTVVYASKDVTGYDAETAYPFFKLADDESADASIELDYFRLLVNRNSV